MELELPLTPMEALSVEAIPEGAEWQYEPKWDGFRCVVRREGDEVELQSKAGQPLARYFPELVEAVREVKARQFVLDGEIAIPSGDGAFSFDALLQRIHPAASRIKKLAAETPAILIVFDLLADADGKSLLAMTLAERRERLERFAKAHLSPKGSLRLSPASTQLAEARQWLAKAGATLDGIIAKRRDLAYMSGERTAMQKIKNYRSADCVVGGFRYSKNGQVVGSLLLGLYDEAGLLNHVGFTSSIPVKERPSLTTKLEALIHPPGFTGSAPGGPSRWNGGKANEWQPLKPKLVVEVMFDHATGGRFRHGTKLLRWRPDKTPKQCTMEQLETKGGELMKLLR
ncbi:MAG TPA: ATP-dependent DNA ligase [Prosthecobacter sp.]|nr:ATP-dependent DNA ligase [Prosthecobacter sp.]